MEAGRELDALVAEKVMGWIWRNYRWYNGAIKRLLWPPDADEEPRGSDFDALSGGRIIPWNIGYSTDIAAAWQVVERLTEQGYSVNIGCGWYDRLAGAGYGVVVKKQTGNSPTPFHQIVRMEKEGGAPLAICLAALKAVGVEVPA